MNWHLIPLLEIAEKLHTSPTGIDDETASQRLRKHGENQIEDKKKKTIVQMILSQLSDFMILILIAAAVISGLIGDLTDICCNIFISAPSTPTAKNATRLFASSSLTRCATWASK